MSYYSSKQPGLFLYIVLVGISVLGFLFLDMSAFHIGVLSVLWGAYTALRALSLYEMNAYYETYADGGHVSKNYNAQTSALAHDLMHRMHTAGAMRAGMRALGCMHERTLFWFLLALFYAVYHLYVLGASFPKSVLMESMCTFFMIGAAFWAGQSYACTARTARLLLAVFFGFLCLVFYALRDAFAWDDFLFVFSARSPVFFMGTAQTVLAVLVFYSALVLLVSAVRNGTGLGSVLGGITVIAVMAVSYIVFAPADETTALWIAGWGLFSVFWARACVSKKKKYVLYQCE